MDRHRSHVALILTGTLALGCAGSQSPTATDELPSLNVVHDSLVVGFIGGTERYVVYVGTSLEDLEHHCTLGRPGFNLPTWDQLLVNRPDESIKQVLKAKQLDVTVFEFPYFPIFSDECDPLGSPHYTGTGAVHLTENDQTFNHRGINTGEYQLRGTVIGEDGQQYRLVEAIHNVQTDTGGHPTHLRHRVTLTPITR